MSMGNEVLFSKKRVNLVIVFDICSPPLPHKSFPSDQRSHRSVHSVSGEDDFFSDFINKDVIQIC